jgi:hypothetical protein
MKCDLIEGSADGEPPGWWAWKAGTGGIIRRNLRNASMQCLPDLLPAAKGRVSEHSQGLESVKKTHQVAGVGTGAIRIGCGLPYPRLFNTDPFKSGPGDINPISV